MNDCPGISIIINTDGRARSLEVALSSLRYLKYPKFEVCVVHGPTPDGTAELLDNWRTRIKAAACPEKKPIKIQKYRDRACGWRHRGIHR